MSPFLKIILIIPIFTSAVRFSVQFHIEPFSISYRLFFRKIYKYVLQVVPICCKSISHSNIKLWLHIIPYFFIIITLSPDCNHLHLESSPFVCLKAAGWDRTVVFLWRFLPVIPVNWCLFDDTSRCAPDLIFKINKLIYSAIRIHMFQGTMRINMLSSIRVK